MRFAPAAQAFSGAAPPTEFVDERSFLRATEEVLRERAAAGSAVILGRAAAVVLARRPRRPARAPRRSRRAPAGSGDRARGRRPRDGRAPHARDRPCPRGLRPAVLRRGRPRRHALPPGHRLDRARPSTRCVELIALAAAARSDRVRLMRAAAALVVLAAALAGCGGSGRVPPPAASAAPPRATRPAAPRPPALCGALRVRVTGRVADPSANELSGLVRSRSQPDLLWSHDDSGAGPVLYGLRTDGRVATRPTVTGAPRRGLGGHRRGGGRGRPAAALHRRHRRQRLAARRRSTSTALPSRTSAPPPAQRRHRLQPALSRRRPRRRGPARRPAARRPGRS